MPYNFITIEGNIGAGKTTLAKRLAAELNGNLILEQFADNPFLPKFYENPKQFAFPLELFFMAERFQQLKENFSAQDLFRKFTVSDYLFRKSQLFASINLSDEEYKLYQRLFNIIHNTLPEPDLIIYLHCPVEKLVQHIHKRGRDYEQSISKNYLEKIQQMYFSFFKSQRHLPVVIIDCSNIDFVNLEEHYQLIHEIIFDHHEPGINHVVI